MKIKIDCLGFTENKKLKFGENLTVGGLIIAAAGTALALIGTIYTVKSSTWFRGTTQQNFEAFANLYKTCDSSCVD